jgi:cytochrome c553
MSFRVVTIVALLFVCIVVLTQCTKLFEEFRGKGNQGNENESGDLISQGKQTFRYDAFGDEDFWSGLLHIDKAIAGEKNGGFGQGVNPKTALAVGLKVDVDALPPEIQNAILNGSIDLNDPATTIALIRLNAVLGIKGNFDAAGKMQSMGITCAVCHSTVDNSLAAGIGKRLDGWPNRDLNVGAIISLTDNAKPIADLLHTDENTLRTVLGMWGPGKFSALVFMDGKALRPDGKVAANLIPAAFGLKDVALTTYTGWGDIKYWNSFVGNLEMHGKGNFMDPRLNNPDKYPIAVENSFFNVQNNPDLISSKLDGLRAYQFSLDAPKAASASFDHDAAQRGKLLFYTKAKCITCHNEDLYKSAQTILHSANEIGIDDFEANRSPTGKYRTTPLAGLSAARSKGGYFHDGRFNQLSDVVNHYDQFMSLHLSQKEKQDLVEYLKSL